MKCHIIYGVWRLALIVYWGALLEAADEASDEASGQGAGMLKIFEPRFEKTGLRGFRPGLTQNGLYNHTRCLEA